MAPPRLYAILAADQPVAAVFRRGPAKWWQVSRWDLDSGALEPGAWLHGTLYPRRCDLSPDGKLLYAFVLKGGGSPFLGQKTVKTYSTVSKLPWLFALAAWPESGTWTRGYHFVARGTWEIGEAQAGSDRELRRRHGLAATRPLQYANERRRGWFEHDRCPPRSPRDMWDERRDVILARQQPRGKRRLILTDHGWDARRPGIEGRTPSYQLELGKHVVDLPDATWADWDHQGRLLMATRSGQLAIHHPDRDGLPIVRAHDLAGAEPDPQPAPSWAQTW